MRLQYLSPDHIMIGTQCWGVSIFPLGQVENLEEICEQQARDQTFKIPPWFWCGKMMLWGKNGCQESQRFLLCWASERWQGSRLGHSNQWPQTEGIAFVRHMVRHLTSKTGRTRWTKDGKGIVSSDSSRWLSLISRCRTSWSVSPEPRLMVMNSFALGVHVRSFVSHSFLQESFAEHDILDWEFYLWIVVLFGLVSALWKHHYHHTFSFLLSHQFVYGKFLYRCFHAWITTFTLDSLMQWALEKAFLGWVC